MNNCCEKYEKERKRYHRLYCQERQLNIDSKASRKLKGENEKLKQLLKYCKPFLTQFDPINEKEDLYLRSLIE